MVGGDWWRWRFVIVISMITDLIIEQIRQLVLAGCYEGFHRMTPLARALVRVEIYGRNEISVGGWWWTVVRVVPRAIYLGSVEAV